LLDWFVIVKSRLVRYERTLRINLLLKPNRKSKLVITSL